MRSGGSVLKAAGPFTYWGAAEGALPREHRPQAVSRTLPAQTYKGIEKALRYLGEPFLYVLKLAKLNLDGIAAMRSGGSVLEAPPGAEEGALPREHEHEAACYISPPASMSTKPPDTSPRILNAHGIIAL